MNEAVGTDRKFYITAGGMALGTLLSLLGHGSEDVIGLIGACVVTFNGANAAVSWGYARGEQKAPMVQAGGDAKVDVKVEAAPAGQPLAPDADEPAWRDGRVGVL